MIIIYATMALVAIFVIGSILSGYIEGGED